MKNLISFGGFTLKLIYPLIMGTSHIIISVAYRLFTIKKIDEQGKEITFRSHNIFIKYVMFLSESCIGFIYLIQLLCNKNKHIRKKRIEKINTSKIKECLKIIGIIFICFAVDFIRNITVKFIRGDNETTIFFEVFVKIISIPVISLLTILILHYKYYRHHLIGYLITAFGLVLDPTFDLIQKGISMNKIFLK